MSWASLVERKTTQSAEKSTAGGSKTTAARSGLSHDTAASTASPGAGGAVTTGAGAGDEKARETKDSVATSSITEVKGDLFACSEQYSLAHCVSRDLHMGKGSKCSRNYFVSVRDIQEAVFDALQLLFCSKRSLEACPNSKLRTRALATLPFSVHRLASCTTW